MTNYSRREKKLLTRVTRDISELHRIWGHPRLAKHADEWRSELESLAADLAQFRIERHLK